MKKVFLVFISILSILIPINAQAKSHSFSGYYCDSKVSQGNGTFKETCHIIVTSDYEINHIKLNLRLKNLVLDSVRTNNNWANLNGLATSMEFKAASAHQGTFTVADLIFIGNESDVDCAANIEPVLVEKITENKVCAIIDNVHYGKNGTVVTTEKYYEECCNYVCTVVDNKYYFDAKGNSVNYDAFMQSCSTVEGPATGINYGLIMLPIGILSLVAIVKLAKKNTKIYKI